MSTFTTHAFWPPKQSAKKSFSTLFCFRNILGLAIALAAIYAIFKIRNSTGNRGTLLRAWKTGNLDDIKETPLDSNIRKIITDKREIEEKIAGAEQKLAKAKKQIPKTENEMLEDVKTLVTVLKTKEAEEKGEKFERYYKIAKKKMQNGNEIFFTDKAKYNQLLAQAKSYRGTMMRFFHELFDMVKKSDAYKTNSKEIIERGGRINDSYRQIFGDLTDITRAIQDEKKLSGDMKTLHSEFLKL